MDEHVATGLVAARQRRGGPLGRLDLPAARTVVVVPHPDDEALATGGLIARQAGRHVPVHVVAVTDGDAAYASWPSDDLARVRRDEQDAALRVLAPPRAGSGSGAGPATSATLTRLGLPDGAVADHEDHLTRELTDLLEPGDLLVAPARFDWHPDHEACGRAAARAAADRGARLLGSVFWSHHHPDRSLGHEFALVALVLDPTEVDLRRRAVEAHRSQLAPPADEPIVAADLMRHLDAPVEYYVVDAEAGS